MRKNGVAGMICRRPGQLLLPTLLVIPTLMLFVYLLFETAKISREKIRQQFAVDSAAFIQMGDYTNLLNRTAYVNGAFPYRIFKEAYECPPEKPLQRSDENGEICPYDMLYLAGAFPKSTDDISGAQPTKEMFDSKRKWEIRFCRDGETAGNLSCIPRTEFEGNPSGTQHIPLFTLIPKDAGVKLMLEWGTAIGYYKFYSQVYSLLGTVELSQWTVFERLTDNFNFFRKSYYLNSNACQASMAEVCGNDGVFSINGFANNRLIKNSNFHMHYVQKIMFYAKVFTGATLPPYYLGKTNPPMDMTSMHPDGLFQLASVSSDKLRTFGQGLEVYQGWTAPTNFFNINFNNISRCRETGRPCVHARVATQCPQLQTDGNNCVWPNPTPKYQTRLYP